MKTKDIKIFSALICSAFLCSCGTFQGSYKLYPQTIDQLYIDESAETENKNNKMKAIWIPVMEYKYILQNKTKQEFESETDKMLENISSDGYNTIFLHVRAYGDAYYKTNLSTSGTYLSDDKIDVLETVIEKAHKKNIAVHAWINPLRCQSGDGMQSMNDDCQLKKWFTDDEANGKIIVNVGGTYWLDPAYEEVRKYISDVAAEICKNYDIDGFHIDDFFYPETDENFDKDIFEKSGEASLSDFRLEQTSLLVKSIYDSVKQIKDIPFSISPQGNMKGNYESQYSDVKKWCSEKGYCDIIIPQLYYGFKNESCPFVEMTELWRDIVTCDSVSLCIGVCNYKDGKVDKYAGSGSNEWIENRNITNQQTDYILSQEDIDGFSVYSYTAEYHK